MSGPRLKPGAVRDPHRNPRPGDEFINPHTGERLRIEPVWDDYYVMYRQIGKERIHDVPGIDIQPYAQWLILSAHWKIDKLAEEKTKNKENGE